MRQQFLIILYFFEISIAKPIFAKKLCVVEVRCPQSATQPLARFASMISAKLRRGHALSAEYEFLGPRLPEWMAWHVLKRKTGHLLMMMMDG